MNSDRLLKNIYVWDHELNNKKMVVSNSKLFESSNNNFNLKRECQTDNVIEAYFNLSNLKNVVYLI